MKFTEHEKKYLNELLDDTREITNIIFKLFDYNYMLKDRNTDYTNLDEKIKFQKEDLKRCMKYIEEDYQSLLRGGWDNDVDDE